MLTVNKPIPARYYVPKRTSVLLHILPYYEEVNRVLILSILKRGDVFIDVGAHVGSYSIPAAFMVGDSGKVIAIEPSPMVLFLIKT